MLLKPAVMYAIPLSAKAIKEGYKQTLNIIILIILNCVKSYNGASQLKLLTRVLLV